MSKRVFRSETTPKVDVFTDNLQTIKPQTTAGKTQSFVKLEDPTERKRREAYEEGLKAGYADGAKKGEEAAYSDLVTFEAQRIGVEMESFREALEHTLANAQEALTIWSNQAEEAIAALAVQIAEKLLSQELQNPEASLPIAKELIAELKLVDRARIKVHPIHSEVLRKHQAELLNSANGLEKIEIVDDPNIQGGVVIESDLGMIDATIQTQLRNVARAFQIAPQTTLLQEAA